MEKSKKYKYPEVVEWLDEELRAANTEFFHLSVGKKSGVYEDSELLDGLLEDAYAHLADTCERILFNIEDYFKNIKNQ